MILTLVDLLRYNDEFNNSFKTFESYMQERNRRFGQTHMPTSSSRRTASPIQPVSSNKVFHLFDEFFFFN